MNGEHIIRAPGDGDEIQIELAHENVACPRHGEPFRNFWPTGWLEFGLSLFEDFVNDPETQKRANPDEVQTLIDERSLCELVKPEQLLSAYLISGVGVSATCDNCHEEALGTPYTISKRGKLTNHDHLCFVCIVYRMKPLQ